MLVIKLKMAANT